MGNVSDSTITYVSYTPIGGGSSESRTIIEKNKPKGSGGGSSDPTGGTQIIVDQNTKEAKIVATNEKNKELIEAGRILAQKEKVKEEIRKKREADLIRTLQKTQEGTVKKTEKGIEIINKEEDKKITITPSGDIIKTPTTATIRPDLIKNIKNEKYIYLSNPKEPKTEIQNKPYSTPNGSISEYKPENPLNYNIYKSEETIKNIIKSKEGTFQGIGLASAYSGYRYAKGFVLGRTAIFRPKFYTEELPGIFSMGVKVVTGQGLPEVGQAIREDPATLFEIGGYSRGFALSESQFIKPIYNNVVLLTKNTLFSKPQFPTPKKIPLEGTNIILEDTLYRPYKPQLEAKGIYTEFGKFKGYKVELKAGQQRFTQEFSAPQTKVTYTESGQVAFKSKPKIETQPSLKENINYNNIAKINLKNKGKVLITKDINLREVTQTLNSENIPSSKFENFEPSGKEIKLNEFGIKETLPTAVKSQLIKTKIKPSSFEYLRGESKPSKNNILENKGVSGASAVLEQPKQIIEPTKAQTKPKTQIKPMVSSDKLIYIKSQDYDLALVNPVIVETPKKDIFTESNLRQIIKPIIKETSKDKIISSIKTNQELFISSNSRIDQGIKPLEETKPFQETKPLQETKPEQDQDLIILPKVEILTVQKYNTQPQNPEIFNIKPRINNNIFKQKNTIFKTQVKRRGQFVEVFKTSNLKEAFNIAKQTVGASASASFRVLDNFGSSIRNIGLLGNQFIESKRTKGVFVEKRKYRINTPGEKKEITFLGILKNKNKKNIFGGL